MKENVSLLAGHTMISSQSVVALLHNSDLGPPVNYWNHLLAILKDTPVGFVGRPESATSSSFSLLPLFQEIWHDLLFYTLLPNSSVSYNLHSHLLLKFPHMKGSSLRWSRKIAQPRTTFAEEIYIFLLGQMVEVKATSLGLSLTLFHCQEMPWG